MGDCYGDGPMKNLDVRCKALNHVLEDALKYLTVVVGDDALRPLVEVPTDGTSLSDLEAEIAYAEQRARRILNCLDAVCSRLGGVDPFANAPS